MVRIRFLLGVGRGDTGVFLLGVLVTDDAADDCMDDGSDDPKGVVVSLSSFFSSLTDADG